MAVLTPTSLRLPILPVRDVVIFPGAIVSLFVGRPRSLKAIEVATLQDKKLFIVTQRDMHIDEPTAEDLYGMGVCCAVLQAVRLPDGTTKVLVEGLERAKVLEFAIGRELMEAWVEVLSPERIEGPHIEALRRNVMEQFERYAALNPKLPAGTLMSVADVEDAGAFADLVASHLLVKIEEKQRLLETTDPRDRLEALLKILISEVEILELEHSINERVRQEMEHSQREYYLREQLKVIQEELGQGEGASETEELKQKILKSKMPKEIEKKALHELNRLMKMPSMSAEATVVRTYLDWLIELPWHRSSREHLDIAVAKETLDADHYGLEDVKDRILEYLAVQKLGGNKMRGQVICFVGPPGVGKTSLARSIARALNRKFAQMSLGGMKDEAEIRGHRRTYVGAMPGRIIQKIRQAGVRNPVMLLDEVDKIGMDFRGDPASALLEVLDPEQNFQFTDHFLEVPFDLSRVMFITTANVTHTIPRPLLDRMEVIQIPGYVEEEKIHIARRHLWPRLLEEHGLAKLDISISDAALRKAIVEYTYEAGVRNLERQLSKVARRIARRYVEDIEKAKGGIETYRSMRIDARLLSSYLGAPRKYDPRLPKEPQIGAAIGLAWTEAGGDVLVLEAVKMRGKGHVTLTGNLGEIMQESAQTAIGYIKANAETLALDSVKWEETDIHVHVPEGAIPKDGPSAGVAIATAIYSAVSGFKMRSDIAMSGEITLRGNVLPVGGIREKILAARRQGIRNVILPADNENEVEELPSWTKKGMNITFVDHISSVFKEAIIAK